MLTRRESLARLLRFDRLRINVMPIVAGPPWGIAPVQIPTLPFPARLSARVCEPINWSELGPEAADDPEVVRRCYEEVLGRMQSNLDELIEDLPHRVMARVTTATGAKLPFRITAFEPGESWSWEVAGVDATDHAVAPLGADRCRVGFGVPWVGAPYLAVCRVALRRMQEIVGGRAG